jgi:uncharacterized protein YjiS (DUF1127 family)
MSPSIPTFRPWYRRAFEARWGALQQAVASRATALHELDAHTLRDIGLDTSEFASVQAESRGIATKSRLRIIRTAAHA